MKIPGLALLADPSSLPWRETQVEGVHWIPLFLDTWEPRAPGARGPGAVELRARAPSEPGERSRGGGTVLIRMDPGSGYPPHRHRGSEEVLVLAGAYTDEYGTHSSGDHVHYPPGSSHGPVAAGDPARAVGPENPACILYATAVEGIELLEP